MSHTLGPFEIVDIASSPNYCIRHAVTKRPVAEIFIEANTMEAMAVAKLFAAAPELLEALQELLQAETAAYPSAEDGQDAQTAWAMRKANARNKARDVILKATV